MKKKIIIVISGILLLTVIGIFYLYIVNINDKLTLETICNMAYQKGDNLSWRDFEKYESKEIGSGLYILLYEIDEKYNLMIGGVPNEKPMYIKLISTKDSEQSIDIRYNDIKEFLDNTK